MKTTYAVIGLGLLVSACAGNTGGMPAAEIQSMSGSDISVVYYDDVSGMGRATQIANAYCKPQGTAATGSQSAAGMMPDRTVASFHCK